MSDLRAEGVKIPDSEVGWFFKEKLGLDALRRQLLETALQGSEDYNVIEAECLRLFRDLHSQDPLYRRAERQAGTKLTIRRMFGGSSASTGTSFASTAPSSAPSRRSSFTSAAGSVTGGARKPFLRQAHVTEQSEPEALETETADHEGEDGEANEDGAEPVTLEEVLQTEVQNLAEEIAQAEEEGVDPAFCEALETEIEASAEALVSMREARVKLAEVRRDRGYKGPGTSSQPGVNAKDKAKANIAAKKASGKHVCFDCGQSGHWSGDPECKKPGAGLARPKGKPAKQVRMAEATSSANEVAEVEAGGQVAEHEVMMMSIEEALRSSSVHPPGSEALAAATLASDKALVGALDSACNRTCAGEDWVQGYLKELDKAPKAIRDLVANRDRAGEL